MNSELVKQIFELCLIPMLAAATVYFVKWLHTKSVQIQGEIDNAVLQKYIAMLADTISQCVIATNQTYVDTLKAQGKFDLEAQKEAFRRTFDAVINILSNEAKLYLTEAVGDFEAFLTQQIEAEVNIIKNMGEIDDVIDE